MDNMETQLPHSQEWKIQDDNILSPLRHMPDLDAATDIDASGDEEGPEEETKTSDEEVETIIIHDDEVITLDHDDALLSPKKVAGQEALQEAQPANPKASSEPAVVETQASEIEVEELIDSEEENASKEKEKSKGENTSKGVFKAVNQGWFRFVSIFSNQYLHKKSFTD